VVNDARQHKAQIKVTPTGGKATYEAAQVFSAIIRRIEYQSKAVDAYSTAIFHQVESGIGYVRVVTDYADEHSLDEDIFIRRVPDPRTIYLDPDAKEYDKADMRFAFVFNDIPRDQFEAEHGPDEAPAPATLDHSDGWNDKDHVREAEYWRRGDEDDTLCKLMDGTIFRVSELQDGEMERLRPYVIAERDIAVPVVEWFLLRGNRVAERKNWRGKYIPLVPFIGEETIIENRMDRKGHTRALIDAQRMYNYSSSAAVEHVALQNKIPYVTPLRALEGDGVKQAWDNANNTNAPYLPFNDMDESGRPVPPPARSQPPQMAQAYIQGMTIARDDMLMVSGQYQAEFGQPSNERSGVAIDARQRQSDNATAHFTDNQAKGIRQIGRICLDLIPKVYDTERVTKIMHLDGRDADVHIDPQAPNAHQHVALQAGGPVPISPEQAKGIEDDDDNNIDVRVIFNPNVGQYDVESDVGPSFGTQRQEAFNAFSQIMAQNPAAFQVVGDFWARNADFPEADQLADRLKRGLPPQYKPGPSPQEQQLQTQLQQTTQLAQQTLQKADAEIAMLKAEIARMTEQADEKQQELAIKEYDSETKRLDVVGGIDPVALQMIVRQMVADMLGTEIVHPQLQQHAADEAELQQTLAPPQPQPAGANGRTEPVS
jgi:hypothetical protein